LKEIEMRKWYALAGSLTLMLATAVCILGWAFLPYKLPDTTEEENACARYGITFDDNSMQRIYLQPEGIIADPEGFWAEDPAYLRIGMAPKHRGAALPPEGWLERIEDIGQMAPAEREEQATWAHGVEIREHTNTFCQAALPVIAGLLPEEAELSTTVFLTAFNDPAYFAYRSDVVMNVDGIAPFKESSTFFNILGHELFHIGFFDIQPYQTEVWSDFYPTQVFLLTLQNDGMAVYTQHLLYDDYPAPTRLNLLLDNRLARRYLVRQVNALLAESADCQSVDCDSAKTAELMRRAYSRSDRIALYVVGAHMARMIDQNLGREALVETVRRGPRSFVETYNMVAEGGMRVYEIGEPAELSAIQALRLAAIEGEMEAVETTLDRMRSEGIENPGGETFEHLVSAGLVLLKNEEPGAAIEVFELLVGLFPEHPDSYLYLSEAYTRNGDMEEADEATAKAVEIDPRMGVVAGR
jgi:tetratricopeptide (TPR) repeat protein